MKEFQIDSLFLLISFQKAITGSSSIDEAWKSIKNMDFCESIKSEALKACKLTDERDILEMKLGSQAAKNADEFVAEAVSCSRKNKLARITTELFNSR